METRNTLRDLVAWQKAVTLHADLIRLSLQPGVARHPWLAEHLRGGGRCIAAALAEGHGRRDGMDRAVYLPSARGEAAQLVSLLAAATQAGLVEGAAAEALERRCEEIMRMVSALIRPRRPAGEGGGPVNGGSREPWRRRPPSDGGSPGGDPWDNRS